MDKTMTEHHAEDYRAERKHRNVIHAINELLNEDRRLSMKDKEVLADARGRCQHQADHIVRVWD